MGVRVEAWLVEVGVGVCHYRYNGKELNEDLGLYDYGARWYDPAVAKFTTIDRFADKYAFQAPYAYAANNPVRYIDVNGDSIGVNFINSISKELSRAFTSTDEGLAFLGKFAAAGQIVNGHEFAEDGEYHSAGIDLEYSDRDFGEEKTSDGAVTSGGTKGGNIVDGRLKLGVVLNTTASWRNNLTEGVTDLAHESFLHVQEYVSDFKDNGSIDYSHNPFYKTLENSSPSSRHHLMYHNQDGSAQTHPLSTRGLRVLESVNSQRNLGYSRNELWKKIWTFGD